MTTFNAGSNSKSVMIVAAEASSCLYARRILENWQKNNINVKAFGIGSRDMEQLGFERIGQSEQLAVVGLQEVISHWGVIKSAFYGLLSAAESRKPSVALLLDYPDFNIRLAKKLKKMGIPVVYYISPQIWAWRQGRVHTLKKLVDKMLLLFPFEPAFYNQHGINNEFVGHPLLDEIDEKFFDEKYIVEKRQRLGLTGTDKLLALMPGSRRSEIKHHLNTQLQAAEILIKRQPGLKVAIVVAPTFEVEEFKSFLPNDLNIPFMLIKDENSMDSIVPADIVLCASGTATLIVGLLEKPMVIMYKMNSLTATFAKLFVRSTKYFGLINLVLEAEVVPELFQGKASAKNIADELEKFLLDGQRMRETKRALAQAKTRLGEKGVTERVVESLRPYLF